MYSRYKIFNEGNVMFQYIPYLLECSHEYVSDIHQTHSATILDLYE